MKKKKKNIISEILSEKIYKLINVIKYIYIYIYSNFDNVNNYQSIIVLK